MKADGSTTYIKLPREQWTLLKNVHPGYIEWEQYEENLQRLRENAYAHSQERRKSPPRKGPALLQGLAVCGVCGNRMTVRYHMRTSKLIPEYVCQSEGANHIVVVCQRLLGEHVDQAVRPAFGRHGHSASAGSHAQSPRGDSSQIGRGGPTPQKAS